MHCQQLTLNTSQFLSNPLGQTSFITGRDKFRCIIPSVLVTNTQRCFSRSVNRGVAGREGPPRKIFVLEKYAGQS